MKVGIKKISKDRMMVSKHIGTATIQGRKADIIYVDTYLVDALSIGEVLQKELNNDYEYNTSIQQSVQDNLREKELDKEKEVR